MIQRTLALVHLYNLLLESVSRDSGIDWNQEPALGVVLDASESIGDVAMQQYRGKILGHVDRSEGVILGRVMIARRNEEVIPACVSP